MANARKDRVKRNAEISTDAAAGEVKVKVSITTYGENASLTAAVLAKAENAVREALVDEGATAGGPDKPEAEIEKVLNSVEVAAS